jgi:hypothetical protein
MSSHGGMLGVALAAGWFTRRRPYRFLSMADLIVLGGCAAIEEAAMAVKPIATTHDLILNILNPCFRVEI